MPIYLQLPRLLPDVGVYFGLVGTSERLPTWTTEDVWSETIRESSMESVWCVDWISPVRCILIRITVTLGYEYRLFAAIIT
jgi:hypothetical protein